MAGKADIVDQIAECAGLTKKQAGEAFDCTFDAILDYLMRGDRVQVPNFGSFSVTQFAAREGRNPATGQTIHIPARKGCKFKQSKDLKEALNE
jgi:DNA-binding protein HU-beta